jgi:hypothetical protein
MKPHPTPANLSALTNQASEYLPAIVTSGLARSVIRNASQETPFTASLQSTNAEPSVSAPSVQIASVLAVVQIMERIGCNSTKPKGAYEMMIPTYKIVQLAEQHKDALRQLSFQLATNFDVPAPRLINRAIAAMGIDRVTYERIISYQFGEEYKPVPAHLLERWAAY